MKRSATFLKKARARAGLNQRDMARKLEISAQFLGRCENGQIDLPLTLANEFLTITKANRNKYVEARVRDYHDKVLRAIK